MSTINPMTFLVAAVLLGAYLTAGASAPRAGLIDEQAIFQSRTHGYDTFRIPALIVSSKGTILAFAEGRVGSRRDWGEIHAVLRRSTDGGRTWGPLQLVAKDGKNTHGNPCPVVDERTGRIWLLSTHNLGHDRERDIMAGTSDAPRTVWICYSDDDGESWSEPKEISDSVREDHWRWYATGPGVGIQLRDGTLVIPANHSDHSDDEHSYRAHIVYSRDGGETWELGSTVGPKTNESQIVELMDGSIMINMRSYHDESARAVAVTKNLGQTWSEMKIDHSLVDAVCQASLIRYSGFGHDERNRLLYSNPAAIRRVNMTVRVSYNDGETWPISRMVHRGPAAYSCLARLPDGRVGLLYEKGSEHPYETISLASFDLAWLEGDEPAVEKDTQ